MTKIISQYAKFIFRLLGSMRFAVTLLVLLAVASMAGTVVVQGELYERYVTQFGPFWASIFEKLGIYDVYHSKWFVAIILFLVFSLLICLINNVPKIFAETFGSRKKLGYKDFHQYYFKESWLVNGSLGDHDQFIQSTLELHGYRCYRRMNDETLSIIGKRGISQRFGYIITHLSIVLIFFGGLLDSGFIISLQSWLLNKSIFSGDQIVRSKFDQKHRLNSSNPSFRAIAEVAEGKQFSSAILKHKQGFLIQDLPIIVRLRKFIVEHHFNGVPKLFVSDVEIIDRKTRKKLETKIEVNKPYRSRGISIYQSGYEDGGSRLWFRIFPMNDVYSEPFSMVSNVGDVINFPVKSYTQHVKKSEEAIYEKNKDLIEKVEFVDFRPVNIENILQRGRRSFLQQIFNESLKGRPQVAQLDTFRDLGPAFVYRLHYLSGKIVEFQNFMEPVFLQGVYFFLIGIRDSPKEDFHYLKIPADSEMAIYDWIHLHATLRDSSARKEAAMRYAKIAVSDQSKSIRMQFQNSVEHVLDIFAGCQSCDPSLDNKMSLGGLSAISNFIDANISLEGVVSDPFSLFTKVLRGGLWELWGIARERYNLPPPVQSLAESRFLDFSIQALSESFIYKLPVYMQLDKFDLKKISVFQVVRTPGKWFVYLGCFSLLVGLFLMFYVRRTSICLLLKETHLSDREIHEFPHTYVRIFLALSYDARNMNLREEWCKLQKALKREDYRLPYLR